MRFTIHSLNPLNDKSGCCECVQTSTGLNRINDVGGVSFFFFLYPSQSFLLLSSL